MEFHSRRLIQINYFFFKNEIETMMSCIKPSEYTFRIFSDTVEIIVLIYLALILLHYIYHLLSIYSLYWNSNLYQIFFYNLLMLLQNYLNIHIFIPTICDRFIVLLLWGHPQNEKDWKIINSLMNYYTNQYSL